MRTILLCLLSLCPFGMHFTLAQLIGPTDFQSIRLDITTNKTTHLIFPFSIISVDKGSRDILAQKTKGVENILQVKAGRPDFPQTNLTVVTADGSLYGFVLDFKLSPKQFIHKLSAQNNNEPVRLRSILNVPSIAATAKRLKAARPLKLIAHRRKNRTELSLERICIDDDVLFFKVNIFNKSPVKYDIESLRFLIKDKKLPKRTASQELDIKPIYILGDTSAILGHRLHSMVFALPKFTIPDKKNLRIRLIEKNGGRHLSLKIRNKNILNALPLESL
jgi:conjugative transposon TraN protein